MRGDGLLPRRSVSFWHPGLGLLLLALAGCSSTPRSAPEPELRAQAHDAAAQGAQRFARGDYALAQRHFEQALRLCVAVDDVPCADRQRLNVAQSLAAQGREGDALVPLGQIRESSVGIEAGLLEVQLRLATAQPQRARELLAALKERCLGTGGALAGRWWVLSARLSWASGDDAAAVQSARSAIGMLGEASQARELANAWRLLAATQLRMGHAPDAVVAAQSALALDRELALPEKIASDWMLIGAAQKGTAPEASRQSYRRALEVAQAAGLVAIMESAHAALMEVAR